MADSTISEICNDAGLDQIVLADHQAEGRFIVQDENGEAVELRVLLAERRYWREVAACNIDLLTRALDNDGKVLCRTWGLVKAPKSVLIEMLSETHASLKAALDGEYFQSCEGCGRQIWPDDVQIPYSDVSMHANCDGSGKIKAGDQIAVDPDSIDDEGLEPGTEKPTHVTAFVGGPLFSDEQIRTRLDTAHAVLTQAGRI